MLRGWYEEGFMSEDDYDPQEDLRKQYYADAAAELYLELRSTDWDEADESEEEYEARLEYENARAEWEAELRASHEEWEREQARERYYDDLYDHEYSAFANNLVRQSRRWGAGEIDYEMAQYIEEQLDVDD